jgi:Cu/Ag efflux pump CusA
MFLFNLVLPFAVMSEYPKTSVPQPIEIKIFSDDEATLQKLAPQVAEAISSVPGVVEVKNGITPAGDALFLSRARFSCHAGSRPASR